MSTYVLMRILESSPHRYDLGIRILTLGRVGKAYDRLAAHVERDQRVLDVGCGTGALALRAARRGATVKGIDPNPAMLAIAARRAREEGLDRIEFVEMGAAELDGEGAQSYDVVMSGLCFSELSHQELAYTLEQLWRALRPGGLLLVADEVEPRGVARRVAQQLMRAPLVALSYLLAGQTTHPVADLERRVREAGFSVVSVRRTDGGGFAELVARRPEGGPQ